MPNGQGKGKNMRDDDRRRSRREAYEEDKAAKDAGETGGFFKGSRAVRPDDELAKLGLSEYKPMGGEKGEAQQHAVHILPAHPDDVAANMDVIALPLYFHAWIGANNETFICPKMMSASLRAKGRPVPEEIQDGRCPACEKMDILITAHIKGKNDSQEVYEARWAEISALHPFSGNYKAPKPKRFLAWVVDAMSEQTEDEGIKYWLMPTGVYYDGVILVSESDEGEFRDLVAVDNGYTFRFKRSGKGREDTKYSEFRAKKRTYSMADWAKDVPHFFDVLQFKTYDEIAVIMSAEPEEKTVPADPAEKADPAENAEPREERQRARRQEAEDVADEATDAFENSADEPGTRDDGEDTLPKADVPRTRRRSVTEPNPTTPARGAENTTKEARSTARQDSDDGVSDEVKEIRRRRRERLAGEKDNA